MIALYEKDHSIKAIRNGSYVVSLPFLPDVVVGPD
jgi:predicted RNase H-like HicB family nuclease